MKNQLASTFVCGRVVKNGDFLAFEYAGKVRTGVTVESIVSKGNLQGVNLNCKVGNECRTFDAAKISNLI